MIIIGVEVATVGHSAGEKPCPTKKQRTLDYDRPSHGRRLHSEPRFESPTDARFVSHLSKEDGKGVTFAVALHQPVKRARGLCISTAKCSLPLPLCRSCRQRSDVRGEPGRRTSKEPRAAFLS